MNVWTAPVIQILMVATGLVFAAFAYRKVPVMFDSWLVTKEKLAKAHAEERDRERQWQTQRDKDDYSARHNDRNILMAGQSQLVEQINGSNEKSLATVMTGSEKSLEKVMSAHERTLKIIAESFCRYQGCQPQGKEATP